MQFRNPLSQKFDRDIVNGSFNDKLRLSILSEHLKDKTPCHFIFISMNILCHKI